MFWVILCNLLWAGIGLSEPNTVYVRLHGEVEPDLHAHIRPLENAASLVRGSSTHVTYQLQNLSNKKLTVKAIHQLEPVDAEEYFMKLVCFCFEKQTLEPFEVKEFPVTFYVEESLPANISIIDLKYVLFKAM